MTRGKGKSFLVNTAEENGQISLANEEMRSEKKTESVKYPKMPISAACSTPGLPQPPQTGIAPGHLGLQILHPGFLRGRGRSVYTSERLGLISRRM